MNFIDSKFVREVSEITDNMYHQGWDERNGGNISYMIDEEFVREFYPVDKFIRDIEIGFVADEVFLSYWHWQIFQKRYQRSRNKLRFS